jgi:hypothetical protein
MIKASNREASTDELRARVLKIKKRLPNGYMAKFIERYPQYNTPQGKSQVYNVVSLKSTNVDIIEKLESISL